MYHIALKLTAVNIYYLAFLWLRNPGIASLGVQLQGLLQGYDQGISHCLDIIWRLNWGKKGFQALMWLLAKFSFLGTAGLRIVFPHWLLAEVFPHFLAMWASTWQLASFRLTWERVLLVRQKWPSLVTLSWKWHLITEIISHHLCHVLLIRSKSLHIAHIQREE